jgi:hypothetical protein
VAQVVDAQRSNAGSDDGRGPHACAEVVGIDVRVASGRVEHEAVVPAHGRVGQVVGEGVDHERRLGDRSDARAGLHRLHCPVAVLVASELLDDLQVAVQQVDTVTSETGHLAEPQPAVRAEERRGVVRMV